MTGGVVALAAFEHIQPFCGKCRSPLASPHKLDASAGALCAAMHITCDACGAEQWTRFARTIELAGEAAR